MIDPPEHGWIEREPRKVYRRYFYGRCDQHAVSVMLTETERDGSWMWACVLEGIALYEFFGDSLRLSGTDESREEAEASIKRVGHHLITAWEVSLLPRQHYICDEDDRAFFNLPVRERTTA